MGRRSSKSEDITDSIPLVGGSAQLTLGDEFAERDFVLRLIRHDLNEVETGVLAEEYGDVLRAFFRDRRA